MIGYYFGMHEAGVLLLFGFLVLMLLIVIVLVIAGRAIAVNRPYLSCHTHRQHNYAREYG